jgi:hypothetical protein
MQRPLVCVEECREDNECEIGKPPKRGSPVRKFRIKPVSDTNSRFSNIFEISGEEKSCG